METTHQSSPIKIGYGLVVALTAWFSVILQLILSTGPIGNFLSFFTIQCNLLVAIVLTFSILFPKTKTGKYFSGTSVQTATALYIFIVALVYNTVLRGLIKLEGWGYFVDNMLHVLVPILFVIYWAFFTPKNRLEWKEGLIWAIFPTVYLIYSLIRGAIVHWYPYPFLDVDKYGYGAVSINVILMIAAFFGAGIILIWINRTITKKHLS
jgi:hypothetical protein